MMRYPKFFFVAALLLILIISFALARPPFTFSSSAFSQGGVIPLQYTHNRPGCPGGSNINPPLTISSLPSSTGSLILIMEDPMLGSESDEDGEEGEDDGEGDDESINSFIHWVGWNIPETTREIPEGWSPPIEVVQGMNSFSLGEIDGGMIQGGYGGPCPPEGESHEYVFHLFAVKQSSVDLITLADAPSDANGIVTPDEVRVAGRADRISLLAEVTLTGVYPGEPPRCGNGLVEEAEQCDDDNVNGNICTTIPGGFTGGILRCNVDTCEFDTSGCIIEIPPGSVQEGGACLEDLHCVERLSCVVGECRSVAGLIDRLRIILYGEELSRRQLVVSIARELRDFLS